MEVSARYNQVFIGEDGGIVGDRVDLESRFSPQVALLVSSAIFALAHGSFWNAPGQFVGGMVLGRSVQRTGSVATSVAIHGGWNLFWLIRVYASC